MHLGTYALYGNLPLSHSGGIFVASPIQKTAFSRFSAFQPSGLSDRPLAASTRLDIAENAQSSPPYATMLLVRMSNTYGQIVQSTHKG